MRNDGWREFPRKIDAVPSRLYLKIMSAPESKTALPGSISARIAELLRTDYGIDEDYQHIPKWVTPGEASATDGAVLKWYRLAPQGDPVPEEIERLARAYLATAEIEARGLGFVILHRCGMSGFYFLIVCTWRGNNEVWETVFYKDYDTPDFALWPRDAAHKPTFCVWELAAVWHETKAWERFLKSARDEAAVQLWVGDRYSGPA